MKTIMTIHNEALEINQSTVCVVFTDKFLSGWGDAEGKTHKQIYICENRIDAVVLAERLSNLKYGARYVKICYGVPRYSTNRYSVSCRKFNKAADYNF